jgi:hypothetical protein
MAVVVGEMEVVPAQPPDQSTPQPSVGPGLPPPSVAEQVEHLLVVRAARAERLRAD